MIYAITMKKNIHIRCNITAQDTINMILIWWLIKSSKTYRQKKIDRVTSTKNNKLWFQITHKTIIRSLELINFLKNSLTSSKKSLKVKMFNISPHTFTKTLRPKCWSICLTTKSLSLQLPMVISDYKFRSTSKKNKVMLTNFHIPKADLNQQYTSQKNCHKIWPSNAIQLKILIKVHKSLLQFLNNFVCWRLLLK